MEFGELRDVDLREAWRYEDDDFTPWLSENLHRLSQVIGIDLDLEGTEVGVEGFSADILASNPVDGSKVLIENQLEPTDHTHLGQILTYLAGLDAQIVIWIAREFREPHLSAVRWLNTHTAEGFAFFAIKVRVVRIGGDQSPVAPLFEVLERPNDWDRRVQAVNDHGGNERLNMLRQFRNNFWMSYCGQYPDDISLPANHKDSNVYYPINDTLFISQYLSQRGVGIYLRERNRSNEQHSVELERYTEVLKSELGLESNTDFLSVDPWNRDNWPEMRDWLHERLGQFRRVIAQFDS